MNLNTDNVSTWFAVRININAKCFSSFFPFALSLELTLTRKRRSSRPFSYFRVQLKQQHYSAKKRHPIKHGLSSCIIGKFSFFLSYMHCRFTKQCYFNVVGHFICLVCHLRFLCDIITMSSISQFHVFCMRFQSQGQLKVILLLRGKRCTWNCQNHYYSTLS